MYSLCICNQIRWSNGISIDVFSSCIKLASAALSRQPLLLYASPLLIFNLKDMVIYFCLCSHSYCLSMVISMTSQRHHDVWYVKSLTRLSSISSVNFYYWFFFSQRPGSRRTTPAVTLFPSKLHVLSRGSVLDGLNGVRSTEPRKPLVNWREP